MMPMLGTVQSNSRSIQCAHALQGSCAGKHNIRTSPQSNTSAIDPLHTHMQQQNGINAKLRKYTHSNRKDTECPLKSSYPVNSDKSILTTVWRNYDPVGYCGHTKCPLCHHWKWVPGCDFSRTMTSSSRMRHLVHVDVIGIDSSFHNLHRCRVRCAEVLKRWTLLVRYLGQTYVSKPLRASL